MSNIRSRLSFAWRRQWKTMLCVVALMVVAIGVLRPFSPTDRLAAWSRIDAVVGVVTLGLAILLWMWQVAEDWENSLPKRLKVVYFHAGHPAMVCEDAALIAESDIRGMAQQMGAQIDGGRHLKLSPAFSLCRPEITMASGEKVKRYEIHMNVEEIPERVREERERTQNDRAVIVRRLVNNEVTDQTEETYVVKWV